jgi:uncharacterized surface protein with fasciclin (FAS1) repeats
MNKKERIMRHGAMLAACLALAACGSGGTGGEGGNAQPTAAGNGAAAGAPAKAGGEAPAKTTLLEALTGSPEHATLANAVKAAGLERTLSGAQPYTLFAPTEAAFQKLPAGAAEGLLAPDQKGKLTAVLTGHIVQGFVTAEDLSRAVDRGKGKAQLATVGGTTLTFARQGDALVLTDAGGGQARVVSSGQNNSNGVVHGIDAVLMPQ